MCLYLSSESSLYIILQAINYAQSDDEDQDDDQAMVVDLDSDAAEEAGLEDSGSDHSNKEAASDMESGSEISDAGPKSKGRGKKGGSAPARGSAATSSAKSKAAPRSTLAAAKPRATAAAARKASASASVVNLDEDEEYDSDQRFGTAPRGSGNKVTSSSAAPSAAAKKTSSNAVIDLDADDIVDEDGFMQSGAPAGSSSRGGVLSTQTSSMRLPGGTAGRKRQLPLSFSQSAPSQSTAARKGNTNKSLASGWDD